VAHQVTVIEIEHRVTLRRLESVVERLKLRGQSRDRTDVISVEAAGNCMQPVYLDLRVEVRAVTEPCPWERFLQRSGNPLEPPFGEILAEVLDPGEAAAFTGYLRPLVESGAGRLRRAVAYLVAVKGPVGVGAAGNVRVELRWYPGASRERQCVRRACLCGSSARQRSGGRGAVPRSGRGGWASL